MGHLPLDGRWAVRWSDFQRHKPRHALNPVATAPHRWLDADVPGEIHLDLMRHGLLAEPTVGLNALAARWVEETLWSYRRDFDVPAEAAAARRAWLVFDRIDAAAEIWLNGEKVAEHANAFRPLRVDATGRLREGANALVAHVEAGLFRAADRPGAGYRMDVPWTKRVWIRQVQSQFSWDWAPRLLNVGLGGVRLEWTDAAVRVDRFVPLATVDDDLRTGRLRARVFLEGLGDAPAPVRLVATLAREGAAGAPAVRAEAAVEARPGLHPYEVELALDAPDLWWPAGQGGQPLYTAAVSVEAGGAVLAERSAAVGFRHVRLRQEPHPEGGRYFHFAVNGRPVFLKGANFVPADVIPARLDRARYAALVDRAREANFNCLRVWGGGLYESDDLYDLADRAGLLVWQEFIFACAKYPAHDKAFFDDISAEAAHQVRRLARHPSLFCWCGNNEKEIGEWSWGFEDEPPVHPDHAFFHLTLPRLLRREDPTRPYWPSSPYSPDMEEPNADHTGDQHPWDLGFFDMDYRKYRGYACRFPNEGGFVGATSLPTTLACLPPEGPGRAVNSFAWQQHDNSITMWSEPAAADRMVRDHFGVDVDARTPVEDFVYWAGLLQAEALKEYIENFRRRMFDTGGALFWMFNDTWPATRSWTVVDYGLRRTPSFWAVRRAFAPVHVVLADDGARTTVWGVNDAPEPFAGTVEYGVFGLAGGYPSRRTVPAAIPAGGRAALAAFGRDAWPDPARSGAFAWLAGADGRAVARTRLFLPRLAEMAGWTEPAVRVRVENGEAVFESDAFALGVCLDLDGERPLADNLFDLYPGVAHRLPWPDAAPPRLLRAAAVRGR